MATGEWVRYLMPKREQTALFSISPGRRRRPPTGYSVLELMTVVLIVAIVSLMLFGAYASLERNQRLNESTDRVTSMLYLARSLAITHNAVYHVRIYPRAQAQVPANEKTALQTVAVNCFPSDTVALGVLRDSDLIAAPHLWNISTLTNGLDNYQVDSVRLHSGTFTDLHAPTPSDNVIYFLPDGTASQSCQIYVTNEKELSEFATTISEDARYRYREELLHERFVTLVDEPRINRANVGVRVIQVMRSGMIRLLKAPKNP